MFENCSVMIIKAGAEEEILRLEVDAETQKGICETFESAKNDLIEEKSRIIFDGSYKPHQDEFLAIENFQLPDKIMDAIRDPLGVAAFDKEGGTFPEIKAVFVGERIQTGETEKFNVAFQRFRKEQYLSTRGHNLFFDDTTFFQEKRFGINISDTVDCYFTDGDLQFASFFFARQVFDLSSYYRSATDTEVDSFTASERLSIENAEAFKGMANTWIRRKIAMINDSNVLVDYTAAEIKTLADESGVSLDIENEKVVIPNNKDRIKIILGFLDEEAYKGPFSKKTFLANSKRIVT